jgi:hypothetical protein
MLTRVPFQPAGRRLADAPHPQRLRPPARGPHQLLGHALQREHIHTRIQRYACTSVCGRRACVWKACMHICVWKACLCVRRRGVTFTFAFAPVTRLLCSSFALYTAPTPKHSTWLTVTPCLHAIPPSPRAAVPERLPAVHHAAAQRHAHLAVHLQLQLRAAHDDLLRPEPLERDVRDSIDALS